MSAASLEDVCTVDGCSEPARARGWCQPHYYAWWRYGDPLGRERAIAAADDVKPGDTFGHWTVIEETTKKNRGERLRAFRCRCTCGKESVLVPWRLMSGEWTSCGCRADTRPARRTHGHNARNSPTYRSWMSMVQRCENPKHDAYPRYGGRGIRICDRWRGPGGFEHFLADMGERPEALTLDRISNDGPYSPENCRWATIEQQSRNRPDVKHPLVKTCEACGAEYEPHPNRRGVSKTCSRECGYVLRGTTQRARLSAWLRDFWSRKRCTFNRKAHLRCDACSLLLKRRRKWPR